jgi:hypothetical protein
MVVTALDYGSFSRAVVISTASVGVGNLTLSRGATLSGNLLKPDGSHPSVDEVSFMGAVTEGLTEVLFAKLKTDLNTRSVVSYEISGFQAGRSYRLIFEAVNGDIFSPEEGRGIVFSTTTESRNLDVSLRQGVPSPCATGPTTTTTCR